MEIAVLIFLCSGLFLGWSLGANDAANVFGTAVGTRMVKFGTAALICSIFVILGAVISGAGAAHTLGKLGAINAISGSFMAALSAAITVYGMTRLSLPVSTSQAIVGAIIGWNLYSGYPTDSASLVKIVSTWIACPLLAAVIGALLYKITVRFVRKAEWHMVRQDAYTRLALILAGAVGAYALGANNIANVMGVFVSANPFTSFEFGGILTLSGIQQLFLLGGIAIAVGVFTYSKRVMMTVGDGLLPMSPIAAWVVVVAHSIVLLLFASEGLEHLLASAGLPTIPLVPVSSSQAVVGAVIGIGLLRGGRGIRWKVALNITTGWVTTPVISCALCFVSLFFLQNVFNQEVYKDTTYVLSQPVLKRLAKADIDSPELNELINSKTEGVKEFRRVLGETITLSAKQESKVLSLAKLEPILVDPEMLVDADFSKITIAQKEAILSLSGKRYQHTWQLSEALSDFSPEWKQRPNITLNKTYNKRLRGELAYLIRILQSK
jgi:PiT family inorganic phosphate transporter